MNRTQKLDLRINVGNYFHFFFFMFSRTPCTKNIKQKKALINELKFPKAGIASVNTFCIIGFATDINPIPPE